MIDDVTTETAVIGGADLLRAVGLMPDGPAVLGRPTPARGPGVYVVELAAPLARAPIDLSIVGAWIERVPTLHLDDERPTGKALAARLGAFWVPSSPVLFIGSSDAGIGGRIGALNQHVLGDRRPHAVSQWLKTLRAPELRVWWANTTAPEEYEDALLNAFAAGLVPAEREALFDPDVVLPFANLRTTTGDRKRTGISGSVLVEDEARPRPPTRVVELAPGTADGVPQPRNTGTVRRTNATPPPAGRTTRPGAKPGSATTSRSRTASKFPIPMSSSTLDPVRAPRRTALSVAQAKAKLAEVAVTADGMARLQLELEELTQRRPEVIDRIRKARELGDLKENADYTAAREEQSFLEGRIQAIEAQLRVAVVATDATGSTRVVLGSKVTAEIDGDTVAFEVVGQTESDPGAGRISSASPVGRALLGRAVGDEAVVATPRGEARYRIVSIE